MPPEYGHGMDVARLKRAQRLTLASLSGVAARYGAGEERDAPRAQAIAAVHAVTRDPVLLGIQAGAAAADPQGMSGPIVDLLHAAGADMAIAAEHEATIRARLTAMGIRYHDGPGSATG